MAVTINGTTGVAVPLGTAGAPGLVNITSATTGIYNPTSTTLGLSTNGTNAVYIDASQNVGIGTSSPEAKTSIVSSAGAIGLTIKDANAGASNYFSAQYNGTSGVADIKAQSTGGSTQLAFSTSLSGTTAERMRIDSSGRVTMPYQPCFWAYAGAGNPTLSGTASVLVFISATTNVGSYYSTANGRFTAPVAGTYLFNWTIAQSGATGGPVAYLGKNGSTVAPGAIAYAVAYNTASMNAIITLAASDYVQVLGQALNGTSPVIDMNWSSFSGHLIG